MESGKTVCEAIHAAVHRGSKQMWHNGTRRTNVDKGTA